MATNRSKAPQKSGGSSVKKTRDALRQPMRNMPFIVPVTLPDGTMVMLLPDVHLALETRSAGVSESEPTS